MLKYSTGSSIDMQPLDQQEASLAYPLREGVGSISTFTLRLNLPEYTAAPINNNTPDRLGIYDEAQSVLNKQNSTRETGKNTYKNLLPSLKQHYKSISANSPNYNSYGGILNDSVTLVDIAYQRALLGANPEVTLLINPQNFSVSHSKIQSHDQITRLGNVFQSLLGDGYMQISCSGKIGGYTTSRINPKNKNIISKGPDGLSYFSKIHSSNYINFIELLSLFLNNGAIYDTFGKSRANHQVGSVSIIYDGWEYTGNFENFSYSYTEQQQNGGMDWDFTFQASSMTPAD
jgi:hypothetical protein